MRKLKLRTMNLVNRTQIFISQVWFDLKVVWIQFGYSRCEHVRETKLSNTKIESLLPCLEVYVSVNQAFRSRTSLWAQLNTWNNNANFLAICPTILGSSRPRKKDPIPSTFWSHLGIPCIFSLTHFILIIDATFVLHRKQGKKAE